MESVIYQDLGRIISSNEINKIMAAVHFSEPGLGSEPGIFIWQDGSRFYYSEIDERGRQSESIEKETKEEILYELYSVVTLNKAMEYASLHKSEGDFRTIMFDKQLELMKAIDDFYYAM
nr:immunity 63 family protein [Bacteroidaceae bacterium]